MSEWLIGLGAAVLIIALGCLLGIALAWFIHRKP